MSTFSITLHPIRPNSLGTIHVVDLDFFFVNKLGYDRDYKDSFRMAAINAMTYILENSRSVDHQGSVEILKRYSIRIIWNIFYELLVTIRLLHFASGRVERRDVLIAKASRKLVKAVLLVINRRMCSLTGKSIDITKAEFYTAFTPLRSSIIPNEFVTNVTCSTKELMPNVLSPGTATEAKLVELALYYTCVSTTGKSLIVKKHPVSCERISSNSINQDFVLQHLYTEVLTTAQEKDVVRSFSRSFNLEDKTQQKKLLVHVIVNINEEAISDLDPSARKPNPDYENVNENAKTPSFQEVAKRRYMTVEKEFDTLMGTYIEGRSYAMYELLETFPGAKNCSRNSIQKFIESITFSDFSEIMETIEKSKYYQSVHGKLLSAYGKNKNSSKIDSFRIDLLMLMQKHFDAKFCLLIALFNNRWAVMRFYIKECADVQDKDQALSLIQWEEDETPEVQEMKSVSCPKCGRIVTVKGLKSHQQRNICQKTAAKQARELQVGDDDDNDDEDMQVYYHCYSISTFITLII